MNFWYREPRTSVEELPSSKNGKQGERIFVRKALQSVGATTQEDQIMKRFLSYKGFKNHVGGAWEKIRIPVDERRDQFSPRVRKLLREGLRQLHCRSLMPLLRLVPVALLNMFGLFALSSDCPIGSQALSSRARKRDDDSDHSYYGRHPTSYRRNGDPVQATGRCARKTGNHDIHSDHVAISIWVWPNCAMAVCRG